MHIVDDAERHAAEQRWLSGGSALPLVSLWLDRGDLVRAAAVARMALQMPDCPDAAAIEALLDRCSDPPEDWQELLDAFAAAPSVEGWRDLMRFVPLELSYQRHRNGIREMRRRGIDPNIVFLCACSVGMTPEAIELVEQGGVRVETIVARAGEAGDARATYLGLAAEAAYLAGDLLGAIGLLRESLACENEWCIALPHIAFIGERATPEEHEALDRAGIGRWP